MADLVFNIAKGRVAEFANRVATTDPANAVFVLVAVVAGTTTDGQFEDFDTLAASLPGGGGAAEATNTNYSRKAALDSGDNVAFSTNDTDDANYVDVDDQTWTGVLSGDVWTDLIFGYDSDSTGGTDTNIVPMTLHDFAVTPDGSDITAQIASNGFYKAS